MDRDFYYGQRPEKEIRALFDERTIRVYQAFGGDIAHPALERQTLVAPFKFKLSWASWIKPSFLWCMARTDWGRYCRIGNKGRPENEDRTVVLGIHINRTFFDKVLKVAVDTHLFEKIPKSLRADVKKHTKAHVQWDPEKDLYGRRRSWRAIQIGLRTPLLKEYAREIDRIIDMSEVINQIKEADTEEDKIVMLPTELPYPQQEDICGSKPDVTPG